MTLALYYKPSFDKLADRISSIAPKLEVALYNEDGSITLNGKLIDFEQIDPTYFWVHGELYASKSALNDYFDLMLKSKSINWLHTINTGLDALPYVELINKGVLVSNNHSQAVSIAEFIFGQVLAYFQHVHLFKQRQSQCIWRAKKFREVLNSRWTIVGFGHIGQEVAKRAKAFGAHVTAVRREQDSNQLADEVISLKEINSVLPSTDVLVIACSSNSETRGCIGIEQFKHMNPQMVLVNVARGDIVDEEALRKSLDDNALAYAILDVVNSEPPGSDRWFWQHPKVSLTPHTSNVGESMLERSEALFLANIDAKMQGLPLINAVNKIGFNE